MAGLPQLQLKYETQATDYWIAARLFDRDAEGAMTLVTRGLCRISAASDRNCEVFELFGNSWRFEKDHTVVVEISQADQPFLRRDNIPSTIAFPDVKLSLPTTKEKFKIDFRH